MRHAFILLAWLSTVTTTALAEEPVRSKERFRSAAGVQLDLLPTVVSAVNERVGFAPQVWFGYGHVRQRLVVAHLEPPDAVSFLPSGFHRRTTTAFAAIVDYTFGPHFDGPWVGVGCEAWRTSIGHEGVEWRSGWWNPVLTAGAGYIWRVTRSFYLDPWVGGHAVLLRRAVWVGPYEYWPPLVQVEASLKVGWLFPIDGP